MHVTRKDGDSAFGVSRKTATAEANGLSTPDQTGRGVWLVSGDGEIRRPTADEMKLLRGAFPTLAASSNRTQAGLPKRPAPAL